MYSKRTLMLTLGVTLLALSTLLLAAGCKSKKTATQIVASGTVASGRPIVSATVTLRDAAGNSRSAVSGSDGSYAVETTDLTPPFLVQADTGAGARLYSVSAEAGTAVTINVTPFTDIIVRSFYGAQGISPDTAFNALATYPAPLPAAVSLIRSMVQNTLLLWLSQAGLDPAAFNLISTPFAANATGIDFVLDKTTANAALNQFTIADGVTTQKSVFTAASGSIVSSTTTTGTNGTSSGKIATLVPVQPAQQQALEDITALLRKFAASAGAGVSADLLQYLDAGLLDDGFDRNQFSQKTAAALAGKSVSLVVTQINVLDPAGHVADFMVRQTQSQGGLTASEVLQIQFKEANGAWLMSGNQRVAAIHVDAEMRINQGIGAGIAAPSVNVDVRPRLAAFDKVTVSGGGIWVVQPLDKGAKVILPPDFTLDHFTLGSGALQRLPAAGTAVTIEMSSAGTGTVKHTLLTNAVTNEATKITNLTLHGLIDARLGAPLTVTWVRPQTYLIARVKLSASTFTEFANNPLAVQCDTDGPLIGTAATTAAITIPATCNNQQLKQVNLNLLIEGVNGERSTAIYTFQ